LTGRAATSRQACSPAALVSTADTEHVADDPAAGEAVAASQACGQLTRLFRSWLRVEEIEQPPSQLDYAIWRARRAGEAPIHLTFAPLQRAYLSGQAPNVAFSAWPLHDLPNGRHDDDPRNNLVRIANHLDLILAGSRFTGDAFRRARVETPVEVVPVPVGARYFSVPLWQSDQRVDLTCAALMPSALRRGEEPPTEAGWLVRTQTAPVSRARRAYRIWLKPHLSGASRELVARSARAIGLGWRWPERATPPRTVLELPGQASLTLSGVVYAGVVDPLEARHNWDDLLTAFLRALGPEQDATLVLQLSTPWPRMTESLKRLLAAYEALDLDHRCRLVFVLGPQSVAERYDLTRASTFYVSATRSEGLCLPLQQHLAAGRPAVVPAHTALAELVDEQVGFMVESSAAPAPWPDGFAGPARSSWHRISWQSLHDQLRASYELVRDDPSRYQALAQRARERILEVVDTERISSRMRTILQEVASPETPALYA
jgi:glycosyltransferase involved in cell wall biosynthesis